MKIAYSLYKNSLTLFFVIEQFNLALCYVNNVSSTINALIVILMFCLATFSLFGYVKILFRSLHVFERIDPLDLTK